MCEWISMNLKCPNCGFAFRLDTRTKDKEELKELMTCPCGTLMENTDELEPIVMKGGAE